MKQKIKILVGTSSFGFPNKEPLQMLENKGYDVTLNPFKRRMTEAEIVELLPEYDGLIAGLEPLNKNVLAKVEKLKAISRVGIGMDNVDQEFARQKNIQVSNTPEAPSKAVAEMTLSAMLNLSRMFLKNDKNMHLKSWNKVMGRSLSGLNVLLFGFGRIGQEVAKLLNAFSCTPYVYDPYVSSAHFSKIKVRQVKDFEKALKSTNMLSLHANAEELVLGEKEISMMPKGAVILNSARAKLIDEKAFVNALKKEHLAGAWIDVFWEEPYAGELCKMENVLLTPHASTYTAECRLDMEKKAVENIMRDLEALSV